MTGRLRRKNTNKNTSSSKKGSEGTTEEEEQQNRNGETRLTIATQTPWAKGEPGHAPHSRTKKSDKGSKVDSASVATKKGISPDFVQTKQQESRKHPQAMHPSSPSRPKDPSAPPKRRKPSLRPSTRNQKKSGTASPTNYSAKRIFSTPEPGSLGKGITN